MLKCWALAAFLFCFLLVAPVAAAPVVPTLAPGNVFSVSEQDATIVLPENFTCARTGIAYRAGYYSEGKIFSWYFPLFSNGNGTVNMLVSAEDCTFTITSLRISSVALYGNWYNNSYTLKCEVDSNGTGYLDVSGFNYNDMQVYINDNLTSAGDGWEIGDFGVTFYGPAEIEMQLSEVTYEPPEAAVSDERPMYVSTFALVTVGVLAVFGVFTFERDRKQRKPSTLKLRGRNLKGRAITKNRLQLTCWRLKSMDRLTELRIGTICVYGLFIGLIALGQVWASEVLTITGLVAFAVAAALTTYYMVETER